MKRFHILILCLIVLLIGLTGAAVIKAENALTRNPVEWIANLEKAVLGIENTTSLSERIDQFEKLVIGKKREGSLVERISYLDKVIYQNQPHDISLIYKLQTMEWVLYKRSYSGALKLRLENIEKLIMGMSFSGPMNNRMDKLVTEVFEGGVVKSHWTSVPEGLLVKVKLIDELSSLKSKPGNLFHYEIVQNVIYNGFIIIPQGTTGTGTLKKITRPANLGRDAQLVLDFNEIKTLDVTPIKIFNGAKAMELNSPRKFAVGASAAGMLVFGPEGILIGLAVRGSEKVIPAGTEFYLQVKEPVRIYTLAI